MKIIKEYSNLATTNKMLITIIAIITACATLGNTVDVIRGRKLPAIALGFLLFGIVVILCLIRLFKRNPDTSKIKHYGNIGFFILYAFTLFTSQRILVFVYFMPVMYMSVLYYDVRLVKGISASVILVNLIRIAWLIKYVKLTDQGSITDYIVVIFSLFVVCWNAILATKMTKKFNENDLSKQKTILDEVLTLGRVLDTNSTEVYHVVTELEESSKIMNQAMTDMAASMEETAASITDQTRLTQNIQNIIHDTSETAKSMEKLSEASINAMDKSQTIINDLSHKTAIMNDNGNVVYKAMMSLEAKTAEIGKLTGLISSIAQNTHILSLNAAVESARAGNAGKGFAVVAHEVGTLASQTTQAVTNITTIITELQKMVKSSIMAMEDFRKTNAAQNQLINDTETIFSEMTRNMNQVNSKVADVSKKIQDILSANNNIVDSIEIIARTSESTSSGIQETTSQTEMNMVQVDKTKQIAQELMTTSENLKKYI
jgi:methyl-accepting chemotaxis protein